MCSPRVAPGVVWRLGASVWSCALFRRLHFHEAFPVCSGMLTEVPERDRAVSQVALTASSASTSQCVQGMFTEVPRAPSPQAAFSEGLAVPPRASPQAVLPGGSARDLGTAAGVNGPEALAASALLAGWPAFSLEQCAELVRLLGGAASVDAAEVRRVASQRLELLQSHAFDDVVVAPADEEVLDAVGAEDEEYFCAADGLPFEVFDAESDDLASGSS